jgi:hypothetical protein
MKKTIIGAFVFIFATVWSSVAIAGTNIGVSYERAGLFLHGQETLKTTGINQYMDEDTSIDIGSVFIEYDNGSGTVWGFDWVPVEADTKTVRDGDKKDSNTKQKLIKIIEI